MLRSDHDTASALAQLSVPAEPEPDPDPRHMGRRRFLQALGLGVGGALVGPQALATLVPGWEEDLADAAAIGPTDGVLVVILMAGGNDGLNMVVPTGDGAYYDKRGSVAVPAAGTHRVGPGVGLHSALGYVKQRYDAGHVAIVQGVGHPTPEFSHFGSMARWMHGLPGATGSTGWLGRWLDGVGRADPFRAIALGPSVPLHVVGATTQATALDPSAAPFGLAADANDERMLDVVRQLGSGPTGLGPLGDAVASTTKVLLDTTKALAPTYAPKLPDGQLVKDLTLAARVVNADLGTRVVAVTYGDFDSHGNELAMHGQRMAELDAGLKAFFATLAPAFAKRTTVMTFSEFGRTLGRNGSGTDHGNASASLVVGAGVAGGLKGAMPSLTSLTTAGHLIPTVDFRSVYATVLDRWLAADAAAVLGARYPALDLFASPPRL
jgi:uncharacterized protein (DUF1501 family)